jgi:hypothetical protein
MCVRFCCCFNFVFRGGSLKAKTAATTSWICCFFSCIFFCCGGLYPTTNTNTKIKTKTNPPVYQEQEIRIGRLGFFFVRFCIYLHLLPSMDIFFCYCNFINLGFRGLRLLSFISLLYSQNYYITQINKHAVFRTFSPYPHR